MRSGNYLAMIGVMVGYFTIREILINYFLPIVSFGFLVPRVSWHWLLMGVLTIEALVYYFRKRVTRFGWLSTIHLSLLAIALVIVPILGAVWWNNVMSEEVGGNYWRKSLHAYQLIRLLAFLLLMLGQLFFFVWLVFSFRQKNEDSQELLDSLFCKNENLLQHE